MSARSDPDIGAVASGWRRPLLAVLAGGGIALGHAPFSLPLASVIALSGALFLMAGAVTARGAFQAGWIVGTAYFAITLHWIVEPFLVDIARHGWMAPFALVLLAGGLAIFWAGAAAAAWWLAPGDRLAPRLVAMTVTLSAAEMLRGSVLTGFPWGMIGTIWADTELRMHAAWAGPHGLGALTLAMAAALAWAIAARGVPRVAAGGGAVAALVALHLGGQAIAARIPDAAPEDAPVLRLVQPNAPQHLKWRSDMIPVFWNRKLALTEASPPPDLVIWPEVSLPYMLGSRPENDAAVAYAAGGAPVLAGAQRFAGDDLHNSAAVIGPDGAIGPVYDKHHLVPFGEYFPGGALAERLGLSGLATNMPGGFSPGAGPALLDLRPYGLGRALPLICYEAIFPRHAAPVGGVRPDWIVQLTNDAWFGRYAGPQQHLAQARFRAVEQGLPLVRVANTGISALIDPAGRLSGTLPLGEAGARDVSLPPPVAPPLFARVAHWPLAGLLALATLALLFARHREVARRP